MNEASQEINKTEDTVHILPETIIAIAKLTLLDTIKSHLQKILKIGKKLAQAVIQVTRTISHNSCSNPHRIPHHTENWIAQECAGNKTVHGNHAKTLPTYLIIQKADRIERPFYLRD